MSNAIMTSRQAAELDYAFERNEWTSSDVKKLSQGKTLAQLLPVIKGLAKVETKKPIIDCDVDPYVPGGWKVEEHKKGGQIKWNLKKVTLYLSQEQQSGSGINGDKLRQSLSNKLVLNANVLDYLLQNHGFIPEEWKGKTVFFWGTIYCYSNDCSCVRYLYHSYSNQRWCWKFYWLKQDLDHLCFSALLEN